MNELKERFRSTGELHPNNLDRDSDARESHLPQDKIAKL